MDVGKLADMLRFLVRVCVMLYLAVIDPLTDQTDIDKYEINAEVLLERQLMREDTPIRLVISPTSQIAKKFRLRLSALLFL